MSMKTSNKSVNQVKPAKSLPKQAAQPAVKSQVLSENRASKWAAMMVDPYGSPPVRSPAASTVLCSKARIIRTVEITGPELTAGNFAVVARPSFVNPLAVALVTSRIPLAGYVSVSSGPVGAKDHLVFKPGNTSTTGVISHNANGTSVPQSAVSMTLGGVNLHVFQTDNQVAVNNQTLYAVLDAHANPTDTIYARHVYDNGAVWGFGAIQRLVPGQYVQMTTGVNGNDFWNIVLCDAAGTLKPWSGQNLLYVDLHSHNSSSAIPAGTSDKGINAFVKHEHVSAAHLGQCRVTAMSILASNLAAATEDGGLIVSACTRQELILRAGTTRGIVDEVMALPESNRWQRSIVRDGAYAFYTPDDLDSYEPHDYNDSNFHDNCVLVAGTMDPTNGSMLFTITWIVEFYTPAQAFDREMGPVWTDEAKLILRLLQLGQQASQNDDHEQLADKIRKNLKRVVQWAFANRDSLMSVGSLALSIL